MKHTTYIFTVFISAMILGGCQDKLTVQDTSEIGYEYGTVRYSPMIAGMTETVTKGTLVNEKNDIADGTFASAIGNTFMVAAWSSDGDKIIPLESEEEGLGEYVIDGYQKVMYRDSVGGGHYWMTVQPQPYKSVAGAPEHADDEYIWKDGESKTFYAYANVPSSAVTLLESCAGQTVSCSVPSATDILMGYYSGDGSSTVKGTSRKTGTASIQFHHPLTAVRFIPGSIAYGTKINGITIENVYPSGKVTQVGTTFTWTKTDGTEFTPADATQNVEVDLSIGDADDAVLLIPQTFDAASKSRICINITDNNDNTYDIFTNLDGTTWAAGTVNTYTIDYLPPLYGELLPGHFTVSESEYMQFSKGNLYCVRTGSEESWTYEFRLEDKQYQFHGRGDYNNYYREWGGQGQITGTIPGLQDRGDENKSGLFQWYAAQAVSGKDYGAFTTVNGPEGSNPTGGHAGDVMDWGKAYGDGDTYTTMSKDEWSYLRNNRTHGSKLMAMSTVCGVPGLVLAGDDDRIYYKDVTFKDSYNEEEWRKAEIEFGLVFLPSAGCLVPSSAGYFFQVAEVGKKTYCWMSTSDESDTGRAYDKVGYIYNSQGVIGKENQYRTFGMSVRLAQKFTKN